MTEQNLNRPDDSDSDLQALNVLLKRSKFVTDQLTTNREATGIVMAGLLKILVEANPTLMNPLLTTLNNLDVGLSPSLRGEVAQITLAIKEHMQKQD